MNKHQRVWFGILGLIFAFCACAADPVESAQYGAGADVYTCAGAVLLEGDVLYMTWPSMPVKTNRCLVAVDVSSPKQPKLLARLALNGFPQGIAKRNNHLFVVNGLDLLVLDAAKPRDLKVVARLAIADNPIKGPQAIALKDATAFLACRRDGIKAIDIGKPLEPALLHSCPLPGFVRDIAVDGGFIYAAMDNQGLQVLKFDEKSALKPLSCLPAPDGSFARVTLKGSTAFIAAGESLTACVSLADPEHPSLLGATTKREALSPYFGGYAYGIALLDLDPKISGTAAERQYACIADGENGVIAVDLSDPAAPVFVSAFLRFEKRGFITGIAAKGAVVFANDEGFGLRIADLSDPTKPFWLGEGLNLAK